MIIRSDQGVKSEVLESIYKALGQVIKEESCYYTETELKELKNRDFIKLEGLNHGYRNYKQPSRA